MIVDENTNSKGDAMNKNAQVDKCKMWRFLFYMVSVLLLFTMVCIVFEDKKTKVVNVLYSEKVRKEDIKSISDLMNLYDSEYISKRNEKNVKTVKDFTLEKDTIPFRNITTSKYEKGECLGISLFEKLNFQNKLYLAKDGFTKKDTRIDLGKLRVSDEDAIKIYGYALNSPIYDVPDSIKRKSISSELLYNGKNIEKPVSDFTGKLKDKDLEKVLTGIGIMQDNDLGLDIYMIKPYHYLYASDILNFKLERKNKVLNKIDINLILNKIDNGEPVVLGFKSKDDGHAVLGYAYENVDNNNVKVYVHDSNLPLIRNCDSELKQKINKDIRNKAYVLFSRKDSNSDWTFIYNPIINGNSIYKGKYDYYIPGDFLFIE